MPSATFSLDAPRSRSSAFTLSMVFLTGLSLSIGWGIRGNFGHEYGAMIPGCLAAIAVCLLSGREDWRPRVHYFAFFGALGWGFGASISYMQVLSYTHSGHYPTQLYGYFALFLIGFVWAGLGGAGTALPAVASRERLTSLFVPLCWIFAVWTIVKYAEEPIAKWYMSEIWNQTGAASADLRQEGPFYWFDSDWLKALTALLAVWMYDLWDRSITRTRERGDVRPFGGVTGFVAFVIAGILLGAALHGLMKLTGATMIPLALIKAWIYPLLDATLPFTTRDALLTWLAANRAYLGVAFGAAIGLAAFAVQFAWPGARILAIETVKLFLFALAFAIGGMVVQDYLLGEWYALVLIGLVVLSIAAVIVVRLVKGGKPAGLTEFVRLALSITALVAIMAAAVLLFSAFNDSGWSGGHVKGLFVRLLGEPGVVHIKFNVEVKAEDLLNNWPQFFEDITAHLGWIFGALIGAGAYFRKYGAWRKDAGLFAYMAIGWLATFLLLPVLLNIRMTPPRGDDWAGILGVWIGAMAYCLRYHLAPVALSSLISAFIGGIAFPTTSFIQGMLLIPGHPELTRKGVTEASPEMLAAIEKWSFYHSANWHSFLEQTYGFLNGIAIAVAIGILATRLRKHETTPGVQPTRRWTGAFAVFFILVVLTYVNMEKNVVEWVNNRTQLPAFMRVPLIAWHDFAADSWFKWSAHTWFDVTYVLFGIAMIILLATHLRRPLPIVPASWTGKGQMLYVLFLWVAVIFNHERALSGFAEQRILTEWVIMVNAVIATLIVILVPRDTDTLSTRARFDFGKPLYTTLVAGVIGTIAILVGEFAVVRFVYEDTAIFYSRPRGQHRFGEKAEWRIAPNVKHMPHS